MPPIEDEPISVQFLAQRIEGRVASEMRAELVALVMACSAYASGNDSSARALYGAILNHLRTALEDGERLDSVIHPVASLVDVAGQTLRDRSRLAEAAGWAEL